MSSVLIITITPYFARFYSSLFIISFQGALVVDMNAMVRRYILEWVKLLSGSSPGLFVIVMFLWFVSFVVVVCKFCGSFMF